MGWEVRKGREYYYRKIRDGDRVRSIYVGRGLSAIAEAIKDEGVRVERLRLRVERSLRHKPTRTRYRLPARAA